MSDERRHAEEVAREWAGSEQCSWRAVADLIQRERADLLARAEAAEAALDTEEKLHEGTRNAGLSEADDLRAKLAEWQAWAEDTARLQLDQTDPDARLPDVDARDLIRDNCHDLVIIRGALEKAEAVLAVSGNDAVEAAVADWNAERTRAERAEAASGQMRVAWQAHRGAVALLLVNRREDADYHRACETAEAMDEATSPDAGRGYRSPEQVAQACAAAREPVLRALAEFGWHKEHCMDRNDCVCGYLKTLAALKAKP